MAETNMTSVRYVIDVCSNFDDWRRRMIRKPDVFGRWLGFMVCGGTPWATVEMTTNHATGLVRITTFIPKVSVALGDFEDLIILSARVKALQLLDGDSSDGYHSAKADLASLIEKRGLSSLM